LPITLDFYEQGIKRCIHFEPDNGRYVLTCTSSTTWQPAPATEELERSSIESMLTVVQAQFLSYVTSVAPDLIEHPGMRAWSGLENQS
jgi:hypothetical protein